MPKIYQDVIDNQQTNKNNEQINNNMNSPNQECNNMMNIEFSNFEI